MPPPGPAPVPVPESTSSAPALPTLADLGRVAVDLDDIDEVLARLDDGPDDQDPLLAMR